MEKEEYLKIGRKLRESITLINFASLLSSNVFTKKHINLDLSVNNKNLLELRGKNKDFLSMYIKQTLLENNAIWGYGGYGEKRNIYEDGINFQNENDNRNIHLGLDVWLEEGTEIYAPIGGVIHSLKDNNQSFDYGPTIILEHHINGIIFYTLYGHLSRESLLDKKEGQKIKASEKIATIGSSDVNGSWPTHIHFQIIGDMMGVKGDFPGVSNEKNSEMYLSLCPNPNTLFEIK